MGIVNFGIPEKETEFLKKNIGLDVFVEGGTYRGDTAKKMSEFFNKVYTIEKSDVMFDIAKENLKDRSNVVMLKGDTREHLEQILEHNDNILFWLDAHWSGGDTYGEDDECPLIEELKIIFKYPKRYVILIDDARLFLAPPPHPHKAENWPSLKEIIGILPNYKEIIIFEDVIYIYDKEYEMEIKSFFQEEVTNRWKNRNPTFIDVKKIIFRFFRSIFRSSQQ